MVRNGENLIMALADEFMKPKGEAEDTSKEEGEGDGAAFSELRKRFLDGSDTEAQDAFEGLVALCKGGYEEGEGEETPMHGAPALKIHIGGK